MASIVKIKRSSVQGKAPTISDIQSGELALNTRDGKLFSSDGSSVFEVGSNLSSLSVTTSLTTPRLTVTDSSQTDLQTTLYNSNPNANTTSVVAVNNLGELVALGISGTGFVASGNTQTNDAVGATIGYVYASNTVDSFVVGNQANTYIYGGGAGIGSQLGSGTGNPANVAIAIINGNRIFVNESYQLPISKGTTGQVMTIADVDGTVAFQDPTTGDIASQLADDTGQSNSNIGLTSIFDLNLTNATANLGFITDSETTDAFGMRTARNNIYDCMEPDGRVVELDFGAL